MVMVQVVMEGGHYEWGGGSRLSGGGGSVGSGGGMGSGGGLGSGVGGGDDDLCGGSGSGFKWRQRTVDTISFVNLDALKNANNGPTETQWEERVAARQEYCKLTIVRAEKLRSRATINHTKEFEHNTKYFLKIVNDKIRRIYIGSIKVNGNLTSNEELCTWLERDVDEEECTAAIKNLGQNKAPSPDGFPVRFYLLCWDFIKQYFLNIVKELQVKSFLDWRLKNTFIALIPKKDSIEQIKDLRPISLIHGVYKIVSKILAERFKTVLPTIISQHQTAFVKKRQILDGVLIANELIDSRLRSGKP
ncbi:uncharacterized protein LOC113354199 [Papaver somniferum]|uniref:uncharacterized protein LOC113354199 n=1 Tax=Papaver somniferum TaxID=3469 RepID=UPI000E705BA2|nr:uncharacterized protein LOC113354199 [Papaver somniferum]